MEVCQTRADAKSVLEPVQEIAVKLVGNHFQKHTGFTKIFVHTRKGAPW